MAKRVRPARHWQRKDAAVRLLAEHAKAGIARDLRAAFTHLGELLPPQAETLARSGRWEDLKHHIRWGHYREILKAPFARLMKLREGGAQIGVDKINAAFERSGKKVRFRYHPALRARRYRPDGGVRIYSKNERVITKDIGDKFNFDALDEATQDRVRAAQDELIRELEVSARDAIDAIVTAGVRTGLSPADIVDDIRDMIGLTDTQVTAVMNFQNMLTTLDPDALRRQLRNVTHDPKVIEAIDAGLALDADVIDEMVGDYVSNYLDYRAATIAQTESVRASNAGLNDAYQQAIDRGALPEDAVRVFWTVALDEKTCEICLSIPDSNPDGQPVGEAFDSIDGPQDQPPDPHPNCRCSLEFVTDLTQVDDTEEAFA